MRWRKKRHDFLKEICMHYGDMVLSTNAIAPTNDEREMSEIHIICDQE